MKFAIVTADIAIQNKLGEILGETTHTLCLKIGDDPHLLHLLKADEIQKVPFDFCDLADRAMNSLGGTCDINGGVTYGMRAALWEYTNDDQEIESAMVDAYMAAGFESYWDAHCRESEFGVCPVCGWWSSDLVYESREHDCGVCDECQDSWDDDK